MRKLLLFALTLTGFFSTARVVSSLVPMPDALGHWEKWEYFRAHKDEFEAVWIGTSHVLRDLDNAAIDRALAERGHPLRSFNFGIAGTGTFEQDYLLHRVLELRPANLCYVFLEGGPVGVGGHPRHIFQNATDNDTMRSTMWHTPTQTGKVLRQIPRLPVPLSRKLGFLWTHLRVLGRNLANFGLGPEIPRNLRGPEPAPAWLSGEHGSRPFEGEHAEEFEPVLADPSAYEERVRQLPALNLEAPGLDELDVSFHRAQYAAAERAGVELIYVLFPSSYVCAERPFLHGQGVIHRMWDFNRPDLYPELFEVEYRWDDEHLNHRGVEVLTGLLVERITTLLESPRG